MERSGLVVSNYNTELGDWLKETYSHEILLTNENTFIYEKSMTEK